MYSDLLRNVTTAAMTNRGTARTADTHRSPNRGRRTKLVTRGPRIAPTMFTAYAVPARSGSPDDQESTSKGVRNPVYAQKSTMDPRRIPLNPRAPSGIMGSAAATGISANTASNVHAFALSFGPCDRTQDL